MRVKNLKWLNIQETDSFFGLDYTACTVAFLIICYPHISSTIAINYGSTKHFSILSCKSKFQAKHNNNNNIVK